MPIPRKGQSGSSGVPRTGGIPRKSGRAPVESYDTQVTDIDEGVDSGTESSNLAPAVAGVAGVGGAAYLLSKLKNAPGVMGKLGKVGGFIQAIRQQEMLSGLAPLKSALGNVGSGIEAAVEGKGLRPLMEILSTKTAKHAVNAMKSPNAAVNNPAGSNVVNLPGWLSAPGRFMGGLDEATRAALQRSGKFNAKEAENAVLQSPLNPQLAEALDSPLAQWLVPFRRTPFNTLTEGMKRLPLGKGGTAVGRAVYPAVGAAHGAATSEDERPLSIPLAMALSARYGLPYGLAAIVGRSMAGGNATGSGADVTPISEYGLTQSLAEPGRAFVEPAALKALRRLAGEE